eukprot:s3793_g5.t1
MASIIDPGCPFYELEGHRDVITLMSDSEKDPRVLGFAFNADDGELQGHAPADGDQIEVEDVAPEDDVDIQGHDIDGGAVVADAQGADIPDKILVEPASDEKIVVAGVELTAQSTLAVMRQALKHYNLSTSGSKAKCFSRLVNHLKKLELEIAHAAAKAAESDLRREPHAQKLAVAPDRQTQDKHAPRQLSLICDENLMLKSLQ